jgi:hypothetical protein
VTLLVIKTSQLVEGHSMNLGHRGLIERKEEGKKEGKKGKRKKGRKKGRNKTKES